jgi:hypothetical protein
MNNPCPALLLLAACCMNSYAADPAPHRHERESATQATEHDDPTVGKDAAPSGLLPPPQPGAINPANGQFYPPAGNGDVINPATGERYLGLPGGYINPNTGEFMPKVR